MKATRRLRSVSIQGASVIPFIILGMYRCVHKCIYAWAWANDVAYHDWMGTWKGQKNRGKQEFASHVFFIFKCSHREVAITKPTCAYSHLFLG